MGTSTQNPVGTFRDVIIAAAVGVAIESLLAWRAFEMGSELVGRHPWLEISQMPGAQISEQLFRHTGLTQALAFAIVFQGAAFAVIALGALYAYRLVRARVRRS